MKSTVWCFLFATILLFLAGCSRTKPKTTLDINFSQHPSGGHNVSSVSAQFRGRLDFTKGKGIFQSKGSPKSITVTVEWWWENAYGANAQKIESSSVTFYSESYSTQSTYHSASPGYVLLNYWWVKIRWSDDDGSHRIESSKAHCYSSSSHSPFAPERKTSGRIQGGESEYSTNIESFGTR